MKLRLHAKHHCQCSVLPPVFILFYHNFHFNISEPSACIMFDSFYHNFNFNISEPSACVMCDSPHSKHFLIYLNYIQDVWGYISLRKTICLPLWMYTGLLFLHSFTPTTHYQFCQSFVVKLMVTIVLFKTQHHHISLTCPPYLTH